MVRDAAVIPKACIARQKVAASDEGACLMKESTGNAINPPPTGVALPINAPNIIDKDNI